MEMENGAVPNLGNCVYCGFILPKTAVANLANAFFNQTHSF
jgi:hypothetical protein